LFAIGYVVSFVDKRSTISKCRAPFRNLETVRKGDAFSIDRGLPNGNKYTIDQLRVRNRSICSDRRDLGHKCDQEGRLYVKTVFSG
jgi:hypothetical protein